MDHRTERDPGADADAPDRESWEFRLRQPPTALWPLLADTNRLFEAMEMPRFVVERDPHRPAAPPIAHGVGGSKGLEWIEGPFEWVAGQWWRFERRFRSGPLARLEGTLYLQRSLAGGSLVNFALTAAPNGGIGRSLIASGYLRRLGEDLQAAAEHVDAFLSGEAGAPFPAPPRPESRELALALEAPTRALAASPYANGAAEALADLLSAAPDTEVSELRARRLARLIDVSERAAAEACLGAVAEGLMRLRFVVLCPRCRSVVAEAGSLAELPERARCAVDDLEFPVDLAVNVEALFAAAPETRPLPDGVFCASGPMSAPHILIQQRVEPGERRAFPFPARTGAYRVRAAVETAAETTLADAFSAPPREADQPVEHAGGPFPVIAATVDGVAVGGPDPDGGVAFENHAGASRLMRLERREWRADALTAAELAPLQAYRALFPGDAPRAPIGAGWLAFAAFAVAERHALYARLGEAEAAKRLEALWTAAAALARARNGGVVRIGGERGVAAFVDAADAVGFALELRDAGAAALGATRAADPFGADDGFGASPEPVVDSPFEGAAAFPDHERRRRLGPQLALGVAAGRALAIGRAGRLDYGGYAAALAERLAEVAAPGEVAVTTDLAEGAAVAGLLAPCDPQPDQLSAEGFGAVEAFVRAGPPAATPI